MNSERPGKSHATAWTLSLLAVLVLYVLTFPFVMAIALRHSVHASGHVSVPKWLLVYGMPLKWTEENVEWVKEPLGAYFDWSYDQLRL